jgi:hypothetical protein
MDFVVVLVNHFGIGEWREVRELVVTWWSLMPSATALGLIWDDLLITRLIGCRDSAIMRCGPPTRTGRIMAKRKKGSKAQSRAKLRRANSAKRGKAHKAARAKTVAKAKPKRAPVKKAARKVKQPVAPVVEAVVETVAVEVIEQPAPGVITVTEVEETEVRKASWHAAMWPKRNTQEELRVCWLGLIDGVWSWADDCRASLGTPQMRGCHIEAYRLAGPVSASLTIYSQHNSLFW